VSVVKHEPTEVSSPGVGHYADCSCGMVGLLYSTRVGSRTSFLEHVAKATVDEAGWQGTVYGLEYDDA